MEDYYTTLHNKYYDQIVKETNPEQIYNLFIAFRKSYGTTSGFSKAESGFLSEIRIWST